MEIECEPSTSTSPVVYKSTKNSTTCSSKWESSTNQSAPTLDSLPEDVLLELFTFINSSDLSNLCVCSPRVSQICIDHRLWRKIHDCCNVSKPCHNPLQSIFNDSTTHITISSGEKVNLQQRQLKLSSHCLGPDFFKKLNNAPNLKSFILENHSFDIATFSLNYFPKSLTELRLNGSHVLRREPKWNSVFRNIDKILPNLEILDLSRCYWMKTPTLDRIFRCAKLKTLILFGCSKLEITYLIRDKVDYIFPIFWSLETFDLRKTEVKLQDLLKWPHFMKLRHLFLDPAEDLQLVNSILNYRDITNELDYFKKIETLVIRNDDVNDYLLKKLRTKCRSLKYLDITDTFCTEEAVIVFQNKRPDVTLLHESIESDCY